MLTTLKRYLQNLPGKPTERKLVVIESDDWGSIRMPDKATFNQLQKEGYTPEKDPYLKYDALASEDDLQALYDCLNSVRDSIGNPAKITANAVMANPDFAKIKEKHYSSYIYEPFTKTLKKYPEHSKSFELWKEGMQNKLFWPQYHGREHINVYQWMKSLKEGNQDLRKAFDLKMISISSLSTALRFGYMEGLDYFSEEERIQKEAVLKEGMDLFEKTFGYRSTSFIANCYIWGDYAEKTLSELGVKYMQGTYKQCIPYLDKNGNHRHKFKTHYFGEKNKFGQRYVFRNAFFEPSSFPNTDKVSDCLARINIAFKCKKPAIIGSHRLNFVGFIDENNRIKNLEQLKILLKEIVKRWPDVEFVSTDQLDKIYTISK